MKCIYHNDLIFREVCTTAEEEKILDKALGVKPGDDAKSDDAKSDLDESDHATAQAANESLEELLIVVDVAESDTEVL